MEIEKKWLIPSDKTVEVLQRFSNTLRITKEIDTLQYFLSTQPYVRVQKEVEVFTNTKRNRLCIKGEEGVSRVEIEKDLTDSECNDILTMIPHSPINKYVFKYKIDGAKVLEIHQIFYKGVFQFAYVEVEFNTLEESKQFTFLDDWGLTDVSNGSEYYMNNVWDRFITGNYLK